MWAEEEERAPPEPASVCMNAEDEREEEL